MRIQAPQYPLRECARPLPFLLQERAHAFLRDSAEWPRPRAQDAPELPGVRRWLAEIASRAEGGASSECARACAWCRDWWRLRASSPFCGEDKPSILRGGCSKGAE